jgi:hypothetical protein
MVTVQETLSSEPTKTPVSVVGATVVGATVGGAVAVCPVPAAVGSSGAA